MNLQDLGIGSVIGGFKLEKELGRGGMGVVYKAHELSLNRKVALKILSDRLSNDEEFIERFKREAKVVAALTHPNIVSIMSFGEEGGLYYFAMEYVQGTDLGQILKERRQLPLNEAMGITSQIADALSEAADKGVVHRDLKPSNIMIDSVGRVKVTDYGIAYFQDVESHLTRTGLYMGTPEYSSPEQASGKKLDIRSDIYSLGAMLYKMLSGEVPVTGESPLAVVAKIMTEPVRPLSKVNPSLPKLIYQLVEKMMARDKDKRFQTPGDVISAINYCIDQLKIVPPSVRKVGAPAATHRPTVSAQRRRAKTIGAVAGVVVAILLSMWTVDALLNRKEKVEIPVVEVEQPAASPEVTTTGQSGTPAPTTVVTSAEPTVSQVVTGETPVTQQSPGTTVTAEAVPPAPEQTPGVTGMMPQAPVAAKPSTQPQVEMAIPAVPDQAPPEPRVVVRPPVEEQVVSPAPQPRPEPVKTAKIDKRMQLPENPVVLMIVSGDETLAPFLRVHLENIIRDSGLRVASVAEIPILRQKMQFGEMPVSWYDIKQIVPPGAAHILLISDVQKTGTMPLQFYGRTQTLTNAAVTVRAVDMETGQSAGASGTATAKFTPLNMDEELRKAADTAAGSMGGQIRMFWKEKRQTSDSSG
ncbi:MAG: protein kinase [Pseudomonadota bacterium]